MFDREDIVLIGRAVASAIRKTTKAVEDRLSQLETRASVGIQSITVNNHEKDRRRFTHVVTLVDGRKIESEFKIPGLMQYRDVYQPGKQYEMGDVVTQNGSMWVALRDTSAIPGKSPDWRLAVKHG